MKINFFPINTATSNLTHHHASGISSAVTIWSKITLQAVNPVNIITTTETASGAKQSYENTDYQWITWIISSLIYQLQKHFRQAKRY